MLRSRRFASPLVALSVAGVLACSDNLFNVGIYGGTLHLANGAVELAFPSGALSKGITVTATPLSVAGATVVPGTVFKFGPSMTFDRPVTATIRYAGAALPQGVRQSELGIYKFDSVNDAWVKAGTPRVDSSAGMVTASLNTFSTYGILGAPVAAVQVAPKPDTVGVGRTVQLWR